VRSGLVTPKRLGIAAACVASLVVCCGLAYWQWERFSQAGGTFQNLGYVFQWPLFGLFPAFMVWRIRRLDARRRAEQAQGAAAPEQVSTVEPVRTPAHDDEDDELAAYNRYLAELNARDQR
jgi:DNA-binding transcriptional regulator of glucitol operon